MRSSSPESISRWVLASLVVLLAVASLACSSIPEGFASIDAVTVRGAQSVEPGDITDRLATAETPKFLGLFRGIVYDYSVYDPSVLQRDLARVERYYRGRGFLQAHARAARVFHKSKDHVRVVIIVDEGPPTLDREVKIAGIDGLPKKDADAVRLAADTALPKGTRFDEDAYKGAEEAVVRALTDNGYAYATVKAEAQADLGAHAIDYQFTLTPGIKTVFGPITFVGLDPGTANVVPGAAGPKPRDRKPLLRAIDIKPGTPYSTTEVDASTQALLDLGIFSAVRVVPKLTDPTAPIVPLEVEAEPGKLRLLRLGGGGEFDEIKTEVHALIGWEDHDFLGGLRDFSVTLTPGVVLYPLRIGNVVSPEHLLPEERLRLQLRQPGFIEARTAGFVRPELNVFPLLVETSPSADEVVVGYVEPKTAVGLERRFGKHLLVTLAYNLQIEAPFQYPTGSPKQVDPGLRNIYLLFPQLITTFDFRDDPVHPHAGVYISNDFQIAGVPWKCQDTPDNPCAFPSDIRIAPEVRGYIPLARGVTFAARGGLGFVLNRNYGKSLVEDDFAKVRNHQQDQVQSSATLDRDIQGAYFRGFFGGGTTSNRGFPLRAAGPWGIVPFLNPTSVSSQVQTCEKNGQLHTSSCLVPIGGFTMWQASVEVRFDISGPLGVAVFCDVGDVAPDEAVKIRLNYLHMACGAGARYDTPVGPIRLDFGYRIQPLQIVGQASESEAYKSDGTYGVQSQLVTTPQGLNGYQVGLPLAIAFGIGEAF